MILSPMTISENRLGVELKEIKGSLSGNNYKEHGLLSGGKSGYFCMKIKNTVNHLGVHSTFDEDLTPESPQSTDG